MSSGAHAGANAADPFHSVARRRRRQAPTPYSILFLLVAVSDARAHALPEPFPLLCPCLEPAPQTLHNGFFLGGDFVALWMPAAREWLQKRDRQGEMPHGFGGDGYTGNLTCGPPACMTTITADPSFPPNPLAIGSSERSSPAEREDWDALIARADRILPPTAIPWREEVGKLRGEPENPTL